ncbi:MAG: agmatinase [Blastocatellia bacterium]|nr:agmatinase [Blastocatellia bacterium]
MSESSTLPMNFGGIEEEEYSSFESSRVRVWPVSYEGTVSYGTGTGDGAMAIVDASRNLELYDDETDTELYKVGIHTLPAFQPRATPDEMMDGLYERTRELLLDDDKFLCMLGGEHSISAPVIRAHAEKFHDLSVLQIDAHADLRDTYDGTPHSHASIMARVVNDLKIPSVQVGIRSISADEARLIESGLPTRIFWARDIVGRTDWIDEAIDSLSDNVYLTIDIDGLDPAIVPTTGTPEPGGLGWYETLSLLRRLGEKKRVVGMDLVEYSYVPTFDAPAFLCAKLVYKSLAYIFAKDLPRVSRAL